MDAHRLLGAHNRQLLLLILQQVAEAGTCDSQWAARHNPCRPTAAMWLIQAHNQWCALWLVAASACAVNGGLWAGAGTRAWCDGGLGQLDCVNDCNTGDCNHKLIGVARQRTVVNALMAREVLGWLYRSA